MSEDCKECRVLRCKIEKLERELASEIASSGQLISELKQALSKAERDTRHANEMARQAEEHVDELTDRVCHTCGSQSGVYLAMCDDCVTKFNQLLAEK